MKRFKCRQFSKKLKDKLKIFDILVSWKSVKWQNQYQKEVIQTYSDIQLCKKFWWTYDQIAELPVSFYEDIILVLNMEGAKEKQQQEKARRK